MIKRFFYILLSLSMMVVAFLLLGYLSFYRTLPQTEGVVELAGLDKTVTIGRDHWGVPHITAETEHDLYFAAGFVCAQDRSGQMELLRRIATGHSAEKLGAKMLAVDILARTLFSAEWRRQAFAELPTNAQALLQAYAQGVNAYFNSSAALPLEFGFIFDRPEPWQPEDSIAIERLLAWMLSMGWHADLVYGDIAKITSPEKLALILPMERAGQLNETKTQNDFSAAVLFFDQVEQALCQVMNYQPQCLGSNAVVVSAMRTQTGGTLLANDTHLPYTAPCFYYLMHLMAPGINAVGVCFPGIPGLVLGRNEHIAWGITNAMIDDLDFFTVQFDASDSNLCHIGGQQWPITMHEEWIAVRGEKSFRLRLRRTPMGPLIGAEHSLLQSNRPPLCLRWTAAEPDDPFTAFSHLLVASDWQQFRQALATHKNPGENLFYADDRGHIGYQLAAAVPLRNYLHSELPVADGGEWLGLLPYENLPQLYDPAEGIIANANQAIPGWNANDQYPAYWEPDYRYRRMLGLLDTAENISLEHLKTIQADLFSAHAAWFVPQLLKALDSLSLPPDSPADNGVKLLQMWDFYQQPDNIAASLYERCYLELARLTFQDEMGEALYRRFLDMPHTNVRALDRLIAMNDSLWFDDVRTPTHRETIQELLQRAYLAAVDSLVALYGENIGLWTWGDFHTLTFPHLFGAHKPLRHFFNIGPFPIGGGIYTLNNGTYALSRPFSAMIGPIFRQISDLSTQQYQVILTTGQSGHPFSPHYDDMTSLWLQGERITIDLHDAGRHHPQWQWLTLKPKTATSSPQPTAAR